MLLRHRLALLLAVTLLFALAATVALSDVVFGQIQHREASAFVERELARVQAVVRSGTLGQDFITDDEGMTLQFVSNTGRVLLPRPDLEVLPLHGAPTVVRGEALALLVASVPWVLPSGLEVGTIRLAVDLRASDEARLTLRWSLLGSGILIALVALLVALIWLRRSIAPLLRFAAEAEGVDPSAPSLARYQGPDDEVAQVAAALNRAIDAIRERQQAERDALAEVAHELAAPLTVVAGQLRSLEQAHPGDARLSAARAAADELLYTSQDLLTLARGELEHTPELSRVDLLAAVRQVAAEYPGVHVDAGAEPLLVLANAERLRQVVRNLIRNAVQATGRGEGVRVRAGRFGDEVRLSVVDDGPGLTEDARARVFERYYSGRAGGGTGVGLTVAKRIVEAFEGRIAVRSAPGEGSSFEVALPSFESRVEVLAAEP